MKQFEARILSQREVAPGWRELSLSWEATAGRPAPGQFMTLRVSPRYDPLLRRPLAFASASKDGSAVTAIYQVRGPATTILSELPLGSKVDAIGPLGGSFPRPIESERAILAAGGIGLGPVLFLAREIAGARELAGEGRPPLLVLGFRDAASVPRIEWPAGTVICTDDGSAGEKGFPSDWISRNVPSDGSADGATRIYVCGPGPMLASLASLAASRGWASSLSAEAWMACGVGACAGCALPKADGSGFLRACVDGPVFDGAAIDWTGGAR